MDIRQTIASQAYSAARTAAAPQPAGQGGAGGQPGQNFVAELAGDFARTLARGEETAKSALTGGADAHALVEALAASQLAVETAVTVRDKVVEAYQELLRMPV